MRVLIVEPDRMLAANIAACFAAAGHEIYWQVDPQEAVNCLDEQPIDAIVLDLLLCQHSAVEILYELRSYHDWQHIPVTIYASLPAGEMFKCAASMQQLGIKAFLQKSITSLPDLLATVEASALAAPAAA